MVGGKNQGFAGHRQFMQGLQHKHFTVAVEAGSGFIEQNQVVIRQENTRQIQPSCLAAGKPLALLGYRAVNTLLATV